jgi:PPM family protein phosphatase
MNQTDGRSRELAHATDRGLVREGNEDRFLARNDLLAVADGVGGALGGDIAAEAVIAEIERLGASPTADQVVAALAAANGAVRAAAAAEPPRPGMASTACIAALSDDHLHAVHLGDSRGYLLRAGSMIRLTEDHSLVAELVRSGAIQSDEAATHPQRNMITRAVGAEADVDPSVTQVATEAGDVVLLCTDGLCGQVTDARMATILTEAPTLQAAADSLVAAANTAGGVDNVTVVLARL